jgi:hypothetical protein
MYYRMSNMQLIKEGKYGHDKSTNISIRKPCGKLKNKTCLICVLHCHDGSNVDFSAQRLCSLLIVQLLSNLP